MNEATPNMYDRTTVSKPPIIPGETMKFSVGNEYDKLEKVLREAFNQAATGKGKERHANGKPFEKQPIMEIGRMAGVGFPTGQAMKKAQEAATMAERNQTTAAVEELLGAIVYLAAAVLLLRETGTTITKN